MKLYAGIDLHSTNNHVGIIDVKDKRVFKKKLPTEPEFILKALSQYKKKLVVIAVESTFKASWNQSLISDLSLSYLLRNSLSLLILCSIIPTLLLTDE